MDLNQLFLQIEHDLPIHEPILNSHSVRPDDLFLTVPGGRQGGRTYITDALARGAAAVTYKAEGIGELPPGDTSLIAMKGLATQLLTVARRFYGELGRGLDLIGVTDISGKTSVSQLVVQALDLLDERYGIVGALSTGFYGVLKSSRHTMPDLLTMQVTLTTLRQAGARVVAAEVFSHGFDQGHIAALGFDIAALANLSRSHLDHHGPMEVYTAAKAGLFAWSSLRCRMVNLDDGFDRQLAGGEQNSELITYGLTDSSAFFYCREVRFGDAGIEVVSITPYGEGLLCSPLLDRFSLSNLLTAVGVLLGLGYPLGDVFRTLPRLQGPVDRMQRLGSGDKPLVVVDYMYTPDTLERVLEASRPHATIRLLYLLDCDDDRDVGKCSLMAVIIERLADEVLVTDDNPCTEASTAIIVDTRKSFVTIDRVTFLPSRDEAIARLIASAAVNDVVLLASKGHEDHQEIGGVRRLFSDIEQAERALAVWEVSRV